MNRTAIFTFYDAQGIVDAYVRVLLRGLRASCGRIVFVVNGLITDESQAAVRELCDEIITRPNAGLDITAYKEGFFYVLDHPQDEDEILFLNATIFGPIYPFSELFAHMDAQTELDFWGMTRYGGHDEDIWGMNGLGYIPTHIQSYFWAVRKRMFSARAFTDYWRGLPAIHSYKEAVSYHEMLFTKRFAELGFRWDTYIQPDWYDRYCSYPLMGDPVRLLQQQRCPVVKRKSFFSDRTEQAMPVSGDAGRALYAFLRDETDYDTALIARHITRTENNYDYSLALGQFIPRRHAADPAVGSFRTATVLWLQDADFERLLPASVLLRSDLYVYCADAVFDRAAALIDGARVVKAVDGGIQAVFHEAARDIRDAAYVLFLQCVPAIPDTNPDQQRKSEKDYPSFFCAAQLLERAADAIAFLAGDPSFGAVVPLPLTHRRHISPEPDWPARRAAIEKAFSETAAPALARETLYAGWQGFVAKRVCFDRFAALLQRAGSPASAEAIRYYLMPLAAQAAGQLVAFWADARLLESQALTAYSQLRKLTRDLASRDIRREDQLLMSGAGATAFFHDFFGRRSIKSRLYFAVMALVGRKQFIRLFARRDPNYRYPYDIYGKGK